MAKWSEEEVLLGKTSPTPATALVERLVAALSGTLAMVDGVPVTGPQSWKIVDEARAALTAARAYLDGQSMTTDDWRNGVTDARKHHTARILALLPADGGTNG